MILSPRNIIPLFIGEKAKIGDYQGAIDKRRPSGLAGFSHGTIMEPSASPQALQEMAEGIVDIFLHGVLVQE